MCIRDSPRLQHDVFGGDQIAAGITGVLIGGHGKPRVENFELDGNDIGSHGQDFSA